MGRLDYKNGRFTPRYETTEFDRAMLGYQHNWGDWLDYYVWREELSETHAVYDEPTGSGRRFIGPHRLPVMHVVRDEGMPQPQQGGLYWNDTVYFVVPYAGMVRDGMGNINIKHGNYVRDRIVYDDRVFRTQRIQVHGQVRKRDMTVVITAIQMQPADLVGDPQFEAWHTTETSVELPHS